VGATLLRASDALIERVELSLTGVEAQLHRETKAELRTALGCSRYEAVHSKGRGMSSDDAVQYALTSLD